MNVNMNSNNATDSPLRPISTAEMEAYAGACVVCLKQIIPLPLIDRLREGIDQVFAEFTN